MILWSLINTCWEYDHWKVLCQKKQTQGESSPLVNQFRDEDTKHERVPARPRFDVPKHTALYGQYVPVQQRISVARCIPYWQLVDTSVQTDNANYVQDHKCPQIIDTDRVQLGSSLLVLQL